MLIADRATAPLARALRVAPFQLVATLLVALALLAAPQAQAQETTGQLTGIAQTAGGAPVAGARVAITHEPSGSTTTVTTNAGGRFSAAGLRVGGPYSVTITQQGFEPATFEGLSIGLGQPVSLQVRLEQEQLQEVVVASTREADVAIGVVSTFNSEDIAELPSINRDLKSVVRLDPKVKIDATNSDAIEIAGSSPRYNSITVDGIRQSDDFGLNNNGYPTQRAPISIDAIEAVAVQTAPYDVQYGNFQGGTINVVTKSGTNDFKGSVYYYSYSDSLVGDQSRDRTLTFNFDQETYGGAIGGPILKDRLFFFASYEKLEREAPVETGPLGSGLPVEVMGVTVAELAQISAIARTTYNFDVGTLTAVLPEEDEKYLVKLDWNITDDQTAKLSWQRSEGNEIIQANASASQNRVSTPSNWYDRGFKLEQIAFELNSRWTDTFSTELKLGRKEVDAFQNSTEGTEFAEMQIVTPSGGTVFIGPDQFRHANAGANDLDQLKLKGQWLLGDHTLTAGYELEQLDIFNLFVPNSEGQYFFDCITPTPTCTNAFSTRRARELRYTNHISNNKINGAAKFAFDVQSIYLQDKWLATDRLTLQAGLRYERYSSDDKPTLNPNFVARNGFANTETYDGRDLLLPRLGFDFQMDDITKIYGGIGLFGGGTPNVWIANSFSNDGVSIVGTTINAMSTPALQAAGLTNVNGFDIPAAVQAQLVPGNGSVNALDPGFEIPSSWRGSIGIDRRFDFGFLGDDYRITAEAILTKVNDAVVWRDLRLTRTGTAPDGRPIYTGPQNTNDLLLANTPDGESVLYSIDLSKTWRTDAGRFDFYIGYAYNDSEDVNPATSSTAFSSYGRVGTVDPNNPVLATSNYETRHRFPASLSWRKAFFGDFESRAALFVERRSGRPYSLTFGGATTAFGDPSQSAERRQLLFIPTNPGDIDYGSTTTGGVTRTLTAQQFQDFVAGYGLDKYRGSYVPRNALRSPWVTTADLRLTQEIPAFIKGARGVVTVDIENLTNLLNDKWGRLAQVSFPHFSPTVDAQIQPNGRYRYVPVAGVDGVQTPFFSLSAIQSVWRIQLGVRFEF